MLKDYLLLLTKYNREANFKAVKILEGMTEEERYADRKAYFKSLHGLLDHIATSAIFYQRILKTNNPDLPSLSHKYSDFKYERGKIGFPDFAELKSAVQTLDESYIQTVNQLTEEDLTKQFTYESPYGVMKLTPALTILRIVNHGTHHRGQISQILDAMNIENDFSRIAESYE